MKRLKFRPLFIASLVLLVSTNTFASNLNTEKNKVSPIFVSEESEEAIVLVHNDKMMNFAVCDYEADELPKERIKLDDCDIIGDIDFPKEEKFAKLVVEDFKKGLNEKYNGLIDDLQDTTITGLLAGLFAGSVTFGLGKIGIGALSLYHIDKLMKFADGALVGVGGGILAYIATGALAIYVAIGTYNLVDGDESIEDSFETQKAYKAIEIKTILEKSKMTNLKSEIAMEYVKESLEDTLDKVMVKKHYLTGEKYYVFYKSE